MPHGNYQECIDACNACMVACETCASECLDEQNVDMMTDCIRLDRSCADICALAAREMSRDSALVSKVCALCAEICQACGNECKKHDHDHCQRCAEACRACAAACREVFSKRKAA